MSSVGCKNKRFKLYSLDSEKGKENEDEEGKEDAEEEEDENKEENEKRSPDENKPRLNLMIGMHPAQSHRVGLCCFKNVFKML